MCFGQKQPGQTIVDPASRASNAAADAVVARRKNAQGFASTFGGGFNMADQPSIARQLLMGGG